MLSSDEDCVFLTVDDFSNDSDIFPKTITSFPGAEGNIVTELFSDKFNYSSILLNVLRDGFHENDFDEIESIKGTDCSEEKYANHAAPESQGNFFYNFFL